MRDSLATGSAEGEATTEPHRGLADWSLEYADFRLVASRAARIVRRYTAYDRLRVFRVVESANPDQCRATEYFDSERLPSKDGAPAPRRPEDPYGFRLERWIDELARGHVVGGSVHRFPRSERQPLAARGVGALIAMPLRGRQENIWGFACFEASQSVEISEDSLELLHLMMSVLRKAVLRQDAPIGPAERPAPSSEGPRSTPSDTPPGPESLRSTPSEAPPTSKRPRSTPSDAPPTPDAPPLILGSAPQNRDLDRALVNVSRVLMTASPDLEEVLSTVGSAIGAESGYLVRVNQITQDRVVSWIQAGRSDASEGDGLKDDVFLSLGNSGVFDVNADPAALSSSERSVVPILSPDDTLLGFVVYKFPDRTSRRLVDSMRILSVLGDLLAAHFQRVETREALSESEERWRSLIEAHPDAYLFIQDGVIVYANASAVRTFGGRSRSDVHGRPFNDFISASEYSNFERRAEEALQGQRSALWEHDVIRLDGEHRVVETYCLGIAYRGQRSIQVTLRDITEIKHAEQGYKLFFSAIDEGIARIDLMRPIHADVFPEIQLSHILKYGRLAEANTAIKSIFGLDDAAVGTEISNLDDDFVRVVEKVVEKGYHLRGEDVTLGGPDGKRFLLVNSAASIIRNKVASVWITCVDRTTKVELEKTMIKALEDQQQRIGRDLHDGVGQLLTGARILSQSLVEKLSEQGVDTSVADKIAAYAQDASEQISAIYRGLTPVRLFHQDIGETLNELAMSVDGLPGMRGTYSAECELPLQDNETRLHVYRIAQEAVNNALKHSGAKHICISVKECADAYALSIEDDGRGLASGRPTNSQIGLASMEYRAHAIGAELTVSEREAGGTRVECLLPKSNP